MQIGFSFAGYICNASRFSIASRVSLDYETYRMQQSFVMHHTIWDVYVRIIGYMCHAACAVTVFLRL